MAARDSDARDYEARQLLARHQVERRVAMAPRERAQRRDETYKVAQRAGKDHQHALLGRASLRARQDHRNKPYAVQLTVAKRERIRLKSRHAEQRRTLA